MKGKEESAAVLREEVEQLRKLMAAKQEEVDAGRKELLDIAEKLRKKRLSAVVPKETTIERAKMLGPMDDVFFNVLARDAGVMEEIISAALGAEVKVRQVIPQYVIAGFGTRGVRLDAFSVVEPVAMASVELLSDSAEFGAKGTLVDVEVQKADRKDTEYRAYFNGASVIVQNTPPGIKDYREIPRAVVIWISGYDPFGAEKMYYQTKLVDAKTGDTRRRPVTEIYINTQYKDASDEKMVRIGRMMELFSDPDGYDDNAFPRLSDRKRHLKTTQEGVMDMSSELQEYIDSELQEYIDSEKEEGRKEGLKKGREEGRKEERAKANIEIQKKNDQIDALLRELYEARKALKAAGVETVSAG